MKDDDYYLTADRKEINADDPDLVTQMYNQGYVFTRIGKGVMDKTRSLRINLADFKLNSENRRVLKKNKGLNMEVKELPLGDYSWEIHKMGKDFYTEKFGDGTMSASKIKELFQEPEKSNMNYAFTFKIENSKLKKETLPTLSGARHGGRQERNLESHFEVGRKLVAGSRQPIGYCLSYVNNQIVHYSYPFYDLTPSTYHLTPNLGMAMMIMAVRWAMENDKQYVYLGSVVTPESKYKLQFRNLEWFDTENNQWKGDLDELKGVLVD